MTTLQYGDNLEMDLQSYGHDCGCIDRAILAGESISDTHDLIRSGSVPLDESSYKLVQASIESFMRLGGIGGNDRVLPTLESFRGGVPSLEGLASGIKNVFMSIINAIRKAFSWMVGMIKRLFGRGKDRDEKIEELKDKVEEIEEIAKADPQGSTTRGSDGWLKTVELKNTDVLKRLVTSQGFLDKNHVAKISTELNGVIETQLKQNNSLLSAFNSSSQGNVEQVKEMVKPPFPETRDSRILSQLPDKELKAYASHEFGGGVYVVVTDKPLPKIGKDALRAADSIGTTKITVGPVSTEKYKQLTGDLANGDKLLEIVDLLNKMLKFSTERLETLQKGKERFLQQFESKINKKDVKWWSSKEDKEERDWMQFQIKLFRKTMDEPSLTYYGQCDGLVSGFINLTTYILHYNHSNGNKVEMDKNEPVKTRPSKLERARTDFHNKKDQARNDRLQREKAAQSE